jgi:hypothetical protein
MDRTYPHAVVSSALDAFDREDHEDSSMEKAAARAFPEGVIRDCRARANDENEDEPQRGCDAR